MSYAIKQPKQHYHLPHHISYNHEAHRSVARLLSVSIWVATGLLIELLAVRFMIDFLAASPVNTLFGYIYSASQPFVDPFINLFTQLNPAGINTFAFEAYTLVAITFYGFVGYGISKLLYSPPKSSENE
jgi:hypothetical protein